MKTVEGRNFYKHLNLGCARNENDDNDYTDKNDLSLFNDF